MNKILVYLLLLTISLACVSKTTKTLSATTNVAKDIDALGGPSSSSAVVSTQLQGETHQINSRGEK